MVLAVTLLILGQTPPNIPREKQFLENRYAVLNQAFKACDFPAIKLWILSNASSDFFLNPTGGSSKNASETIQLLKSQFLVLKSVGSSRMKLGNFAFHPDRMSCSVKSHLDAMTKDKRHVISDSISVNVWKQVKGNWKLASMVTTDQHTSINGKAVG